MVRPDNLYVNPHLDGSTFSWVAGPVGVLICHGFTATTAELRPLAGVLHQHGYTVAAPLLPGHGTIPEDMNHVHWQDWVAAVQAAFERLQENCDRVWIGGESMGALLALYLASLNPDAAGVLAYGPALRLRGTWTDLVLLSLAAPFKKWVKKRNRESNTYVDSRWQGYTVRPLKAVQQFFSLQRATQACLDKITQPVLIIQGRDDMTVDPASPALIARGIRSNHIEIHWMAQSSHCVIIDREFDQVANLTLRFIESVPGSK